MKTVQTQAAHRRFSTPLRVMAAAATAAATLAMVFGCGPNLVASNFKSHYQARTRTVAIAPLANDSTDPEGAAGAKAIREAIFHELARRRDKYTVTIQDIAETDARIHESGMSDSSAARLPGIDLCKVIGADAVMKGSVTRYVKVGHGSGFANFSAALFSTPNSEVSLDVAIFDGTDGTPVFQYNIEKDGDLLNSPEELFNQVGRELAKEFPYRK